MPFYQRSWNAVLGNEAPPVPKNLRTTPAIENDPGQAPIEQAEQPQPANVERDFLLQMQDSLSKQVQILNTTSGAQMIKEADNFLNYEVLKEKVIFKGFHSSINMCVNPQMFGDAKIVCREFKPSSLITPNDLYLKILRRIGKEEPCIIATLDIFYDEHNKHIFLFQEQANGNGMEWIKAGNKATELHILYWTQSIYSALNYLGGIGICHNSLQPKHIMLIDTNGQLGVKLGSFRDACIYWDPIKKDIIDQPCKSTQSLKQTFFRAPEVFGQEGECYDPILADIWSLGCTMFYFVSHTYPFDPVQVPENGVEVEIRNTLAASNVISDGAKYFLFGLMRTNTKNRTEFSAIPMDPWFQGQEVA